MNTSRLIWAGRILSVLIAAPFLIGGFLALSGNREVLQAWSFAGWPGHLLPILSTIEVISAFLYLIPRTIFFGAILITGYLGGVIATHLRMGDNKVIWYILLGILVWVAVGLRNPKMRYIIARPR